MSQFAISDRYRRPLCATLLALLAAVALVDGVLATGSTVEGEALIAARPDDPQSYLTAARYARERGNLAEALEILERGRGRAAPSAELLGALGDLYWQLEWRGDAVAAFRAAVAAAPETPDPCRRLVSALAATGEAEQGERLCREYLARWSDDPGLYVALGECLEKRNEYPEAFAAYGRAIEIDAEMAVAHSRRGRMFCLMGQYEAAIAACRLALIHDPDDSLAHAYMGIACAEMGRYWEARIHAAAAEQAGMTMDAVWERLGEWREDSQP